VQVDKNGKGTYGLLQQSQYATYRGARAATQATSLADPKYRDLNRTALEMECFESLRHLLAPPTPLEAIKVPTYLSEWWMQLYHLAPQSDLIRQVSSIIARTLREAMKPYWCRCSLLSTSAFILGHAKSHPALRNRGIELYSHAIRLLSRELQPSQLAKRGSAFFDLTMAGYALAIYEVSAVESVGVDSLT
jgi:hypothetical protein